VRTLNAACFLRFTFGISPPGWTDAPVPLSRETASAAAVPHRSPLVVLRGNHGAMARESTETWVQLATRIPKSLHRELKLHCVTADTSMMDW